MRWRISITDASKAVVAASEVSHRYGDRMALDRVTLSVQEQEIFGFLGPNGSGKTTLFRILSTLIPPSEGRAAILGMDAVAQRDEVRRHIGVVFQSPSLDKQLTAAENLRHHGHLYGLRGAALEARVGDMLSTVGLADRANEIVGGFSGGMRRRVELAKGMLTSPRVLLLDEPSTGLDPAARIDLWEYLQRVRRENAVTILLTTHLMDEADRCDRLGILQSGKLLACESPSALKSRIGGDVISMRTQADPLTVQQRLRERLGVEADIVDGVLRIERRDGHAFVPQIVEALSPGGVESISIGKPTLEDVFVRLTGHRFSGDENIVVDQAATRPRRSSNTQA